MIDEGPPGNGKGGRQAAYPETANANDAGQSVNDSAVFRNRRIVRVRHCLEPDIWKWLAWEAACNTGGWLP